MDKVFFKKNYLVHFLGDLKRGKTRIQRKIQFRISWRYRSFRKTCNAYTSVRLPSDILAAIYELATAMLRNALASGYVPVLRAVLHGRTSFHFACSNAFDFSLSLSFSVSVSLFFLRFSLRNLFSISASRFPVARSSSEVRRKSKLGFYSA